jgi:hypothetical protein
MRRPIFLGLALLVAGCAGIGAGTASEATPFGSPRPTLAPGMSPVPLRTFALASPGSDAGQVCPAFAVTDPVEGTLAGDRSDPEHVWLVGSSGGRISVTWPAGFTLVFAPEATLYDQTGQLFARAGDTIDLGQIRVSSHAGTPADPYLVAGLISASAANGNGPVDCVPAADGTPYASP